MTAVAMDDYEYLRERIDSIAVAVDALRESGEATHTQLAHCLTELRVRLTVLETRLGARVGLVGGVSAGGVVALIELIRAFVL